MSKRSRLRTQGVRRRRLIILITLAVVILGGLIWFGSEESPRLLDKMRGLFGLNDVAVTSLGGRARGTIYDRNYKELAVSYERVSVYANIREIGSLAEAIDLLAPILETSRSELNDRVGKGSLRVWLARDISQEQEEKIRELDLPGIFLHREYIRHYPQKASAAHLVGYVEGDAGLAGIEHYLSQLEKRHRLEEGERGDLPKVGEGRPGVDGRHLILTLDLKIQRILDDFLGTISGSAPGVKVGALVMEAGSGSLIGYSQVPSFDPNRFNTYSASAFEDVFSETMAVPEVFKGFLRDVSLLESQFEKQDNPGAWSVLADKRKLGVQLQLWERLGAGSPASLDFVSSSGTLSPRVAYAPSSSLEQRDFETVPVMQTPLQILTAVARIVKDGTNVTPHAGARFVLRRNQSEFLLEDLNPEMHGGLLHKGVSAEARRLFVSQAHPGPLRSSAMEGMATSYKMDGGMEAFRKNYLLITLIPADNPELVLMTVGSWPGYHTETKKGYSMVEQAFDTVAPVVALQRVMKNLADMMSPREAGKMNYQGTGFEERGQSVTPSGQTADRTSRMPRLVGLSLRKSLRILQVAEVTVEILGSGRVVEQHPAAGETLKSGDKVVIVLRPDKVDAEFKMETEAEQE